MEDNEVNLSITGMTCNHCASTVNGIIKQEGGDNVHVDYLMGEAHFNLDNVDKLTVIASRLKKAGYEANLNGTNLKTSRFSNIEKKLFFTLPFSLVLFSHMFLPMHWFINNPVVQLCLSLPVISIGVVHFGSSSFQALKSNTINMDILILIGSSSAFIYSLVGMIWFSDQVHDFLFFETTSTIITLVLLGYVIEEKAVQKTTMALKSIIKRRPEKAKKLVQQGLNQDLQIINASDIKIGDTLLVNSGDAVPVDGRILHGTIKTDQSMLTGEAESVSLGATQTVMSGSIVVDGNATIEAINTESKSTLGMIVDLAKQSRADKPEIQKLADRISSWFVPVVLFVALLTWALNFWLLQTGLTDAIIRSIAVLVIACPCAMGLATPTAVSVGLGLASLRGIIVKKASTFEAINAGEIFIFDKTGTLTTGKMNFNLTIVDSNFDKDEVWPLISAIERHSSHPIAHSLIEASVAQPASAVEKIEEVKGKGMKAEWMGSQILFGSSKFTDQDNTEGDLYLTMDGKLVAFLSKAEELKQEAKKVVEEITQSGKQVVLLSGDSEKKTKEVANILGINEFFGDQLPEHKLAFIKAKQQRENVIMLGDGINDAPALAASSVGISIGTNNALASDSASVVIVGSSLNRLYELIKISKAVVRTIRQNLFWAFSYNLIAIPLAALGYLDPMLAALSMAFSDVIVIGNSIRLKLVLPKSID